jgi:hypothetical protein
VASGKCSPLTVAGAAVGLHRSARALDGYHIPSSLFPLKEAIKGASTTLRRGVVNGPAVRVMSQFEFRGLDGSPFMSEQPRHCIVAIVPCNDIEASTAFYAGTDWLARSASA